MKDLTKVLGALGVTEEKLGEALIGQAGKLRPDFDLVADLLEGFPGILVPQDAKDKALFRASHLGNDARMVDALVSGGANVQARNERGETPLMVASRDGFLAQARALIETGADVTSRDTRGISCLSWAALNGNKEIVGDLLKAGATDTVRDIYNETAADKARLRKHTEISALLNAAAAPPAPESSPKPRRHRKRPRHGH